MAKMPLFWRNRLVLNPPRMAKRPLFWRNRWVFNPPRMAKITIFWRNREILNQPKAATTRPNVHFNTSTPHGPSVTVFSKPKTLMSKDMALSVVLTSPRAYEPSAAWRHQ